MSRHLDLLDQLLATADRALRTVASTPAATRPYPAPAHGADAAELTLQQRAEAAALMRVDHVGEVCAQALYEAQALGTPDPRLRGRSPKPRAKRPTIWPGPGGASPNWAAAPACSIRCGTAAPSPLA